MRAATSVKELGSLWLLAATSTFYSRYCYTLTEALKLVLLYLLVGECHPNILEFVDVIGKEQAATQLKVTQRWHRHTDNTEEQNSKSGHLQYTLCM